MANKNVGYEVVKFLSNQPNVAIVALFLTDINEKDDKKIIKALNNDSTLIFKGVRMHDRIEVLSQLPDFDFIVTVFWPYLLKSDILSLARVNTINFHPALLPLNRGWYPHVFNILHGSKAGVTLHCIDKKADTGNIWAQKIVSVYSDDTSDKLYYRLQHEIITLFKESWDGIVNGKLVPFSQENKVASYNSIKDVQAYDQIQLDLKYTGKEIINRLRARTFEDFGYAYFIDDEGSKIRLSLSLEKERKT